MSDLTKLSKQINVVAESSNRIIIAIAGAPGSGKSTLVTELEKTLKQSVVVPMDGFHLDNVILKSRNLMSRKGSPESFDTKGFYQLLSRLKHSKETVFAPIFDRNADLSRAGAIEINRDAKIILAEGNYLLLKQDPWNKLRELFNLTVFLDVPQTVLRERLINRWLEHGLTREDAIKRAESNDLINSALVVQHSEQADVVINYF